MASSDISLAPGPIETFCLAALESIASGTPVVASQTSAVGEFLAIDSEHPAGLTVANNALAFADGIEKLLESDLSEITIACREQAERFPWDRTIELLLAIGAKETDLFPTPPKLRVA